MRNYLGKNCVKNNPTWQVPDYEIKFWNGKQKKYCVIIPVINEGERINNFIKRVSLVGVSEFADIIIIDGGSTDDSLNISELKMHLVSGLLLKLGPGKLSAQLRCAYAFALGQGYQGVITIDGNDKDDPVSIADFIHALEDGADFVQASRFMPGGIAENTPKFREYAIRFVHAPLLRFASGFKWTDTTQGFRGYSSKMLLAPEIAPFRNVFLDYELLAYLSYRVPRMGFNCLELPTARRYPPGKAPTKINLIKGNWSVFKTLLLAIFGYFNP